MSTLSTLHPAVAESTLLPPANVLVGPSPAISWLWSQIRRVAPHFRAALLVGERGTGHDAVAQALHELSPRSAAGMRTLNASEAEMRLTQSTLPRLANETVHFTHIDRLSIAAQRNLLRLVRQRRPHQVYILASCSSELRPLVSAGLFLPELAAALSALQLTLPTLAKRRDDIPLLVARLLAHHATEHGVSTPALEPEFVQALCEQPWPGNLEQLSAFLRSVVAGGRPVEPAAVAAMQELPPEPVCMPMPEPATLHKLEHVIQNHIRRVLLACNGNKLRAAETLGISRSTLYRMLESGETTGFPLPLAS